MQNPMKGRSSDRDRAVHSCEARAQRGLSCHRIAERGLIPHKKLGRTHWLLGQGRPGQAKQQLQFHASQRRHQRELEE